MEKTKQTSWQKIKESLIVKVAILLFTFAIGAVFTQIRFSRTQAEQVQKNTEGIIEVKKEVKVVQDTLSVLCEAMDAKLGKEQFSKEIQVFRNVNDSSLMIVNSMRADQMEFIKDAARHDALQERHYKEMKELLYRVYNIPSTQ